MSHPPDSSHHRELALTFFILLLVSVLRFWVHRQSRVDLAPPPAAMGGNATEASPPVGPDAGRWQRMNAALQKLPAEQRKIVEERMQKDQAFFATLGKLSPDQRRQKIGEYFSQNPPPSFPGLDGPPPAIGGSGEWDREPGPGNPGSGPMHLPSPAARHSLDQQIVNAHKNAGGL